MPATLFLFLCRALIARLLGREAAPIELPSVFGGPPVYLMGDGRVLPAIAGADDDEDDDSDDDSEDDDEDEDDDSDDEDDDDSDEEDDDDSDDDEVDEDELPKKVKDILRKERKARRDAEKRAKRAERGDRGRDSRRSRRRDDDDEDDRDRDRRDDRRRGRRSSRERREERSNEQREDRATERIREANLRDALAEKGVRGKAAKTAIKLLDVDYDDDDEPIDLDDAIAAAREEHGKDVIRRRRKPGKTGGRDGGKEKKGAKPDLTADELDAAKAFGMTPEEYVNYKKTNPTLPEPERTKDKDEPTA